MSHFEAVYQVLAEVVNSGELSNLAYVELPENDDLNSLWDDVRQLTELQQKDMRESGYLAASASGYRTRTCELNRPTR
jgi:hypothetical protein